MSDDPTSFGCHELDPRLAARVDRLLPEVGRASRRVLKLICDQPAVFLSRSAIQIGILAETSDATVVRTVQALGYAGLPELKRALRAALVRASTPVQDLRRTLRWCEETRLDPSDLPFQAVDRSLALLRGAGSRSDLARAATMLGSAARLVVGATPGSGWLARYAADLLSRFGWPAQALTDHEGGFDDLGTGDTLLLLAPEPLPAESQRALQDARARGAVAVLLGDQEGEEPGADILVRLPSVPGYVSFKAAHIMAAEALCLRMVGTDPDRAIATATRDDMKQVSC